jgi:phosphatidylglycerophosphatase A
LKKVPFGSVALATWFGCGFSPFAPGTAGSLGALVAVPVWVHSGWSPPWFAALAAAASPLSILAADRTAKWHGKKDPGLVVVDEVLGHWLTLAGAVTLNWTSVVAAFFLFRLFDIWKPWPVSWADTKSGGRGIVADDLMAGVYGSLVLFAAGCFNLY